MKNVLLASGLLLSGVLFAQSATEGVQVDFGGEVRMRYEGYNYLPSGHGQGDHVDYLRVRSRLWGKMTAGDLEGFLRVGNEFRHYRSQSQNKGDRRFPDVWYIDQLYFKVSDLWDLVDMKVGRQEFLFGSGRIFSDLTGGDGSRSNYADGLRLTFNFDQKRTLDAFAFYVNNDDWLPTAGHRHAARVKHTKSYDYNLTGYNHDEAAAGLYYTDASNEELPWEAYYIFKAEYDRKDIANGVDVIPEGENHFLTHTAGVRLLPKFTETVSGELEVAGQLGEDSLVAMMAYGALTYAPKMAWDPKFTAAVYYMSGDKHGARGNRAWHPVFDRDSIIGESFDSTYPNYAHNNILYPHIVLDLTPAEHHRVRAHAGPVFAPVAELKNDNGEQYGHFYGYLVKLRYMIALGKMMKSQYVKDLNLAILGEYMTKGSYYDADERNDAFFLRFELLYRF